jgi:thymidylate synthase (FAD)
MSDIHVKSYFDVDLAKCAGSDQFICETARVSTVGADAYATDESAGLINFLMKNRHGSPFEHGMLSFRITAPIFVWREFMRHRIGFSYNEQSGRYMEMLPYFYMPPRDRNLTQVGKPGHYTFEPGTDEQYRIMIESKSRSVRAAWDEYQLQLAAGIAKEVARTDLPLSIFSSAYVTCNPRSMMSFLSLRTKHEDSTFPSYPQWEINQVANIMESFFMERFPLTHAAFDKNGRVSP